MMVKTAEALKERVQKEFENVVRIKVVEEVEV